MRVKEKEDIVIIKIKKDGSVFVELSETMFSPKEFRIRFKTPLGSEVCFWREEDEDKRRV